MEDKKPSPGPALIRSMNAFVKALKEGTLDQFKQTRVRPSTGTRVVIEPKKSDVLKRLAERDKQMSENNDHVGQLISDNISLRRSLTEMDEFFHDRVVLANMHLECGCFESEEFQHYHRGLIADWEDLKAERKPSA
jgi:hypothetical protein